MKNEIPAVHQRYTQAGDRKRYPAFSMSGMLPDFVADLTCLVDFMYGGQLPTAKNKTEIAVATAFDGEPDATDVFVSPIT